MADVSGYFLPRGLYLPALDRNAIGIMNLLAKVGDVFKRGDAIGTTLEGRFHHHDHDSFFPLWNYTLTWVIPHGSYTIDTVVAKAKDEKGKEHEFTMVQRWPVKNALIEGEKIKPTKMMDTGERIIDTQFPVMKGGTFCTPGPFGAGKTVLQHHLSKYSSVDIVIFVPAANAPAK